MTNHTDWSSALRNVDSVVHTAARVHVMKETAENALEEFRKVNVDATVNLARQANEAGVKRFVFLSSIKVNGEFTLPGKPITEHVISKPTDPYALSKYEAEQALLKLSSTTHMEIVIVRPPLVYGPEVKANFSLMMRLVSYSIPVPFGLINNQRSLIGLENLVDFITVCMSHPKAANQVFVVSDNEDVSTTELLTKIAQALNKKLWLIRLPASLLLSISKLTGKQSVAKRLFESLQVDSSKSRELLNWTPQTTMVQQLKKMAKYKND
jgi:nucleoside-diphosphate-sugar epimerase